MQNSTSRTTSVRDHCNRCLHDIPADKKHPQRLAAAKEVLERNGLDGYGIPTPVADSPAISQTFNVSSVKLNELCDAKGLILVGKVLKGTRSLRP
jgi:hypothetical protein